MEFVYSAAFLRAQLYNIEPISDPIKVAHLARAIISPEFKPREGIKIAVTDAEAAANDEAGPEGGCKFNIILFFRRLLNYGV